MLKSLKVSSPFVSLRTLLQLTSFTNSNMEHHNQQTVAYNTFLNYTPIKILNKGDVHKQGMSKYALSQKDKLFLLSHQLLRCSSLLKIIAFVNKERTPTKNKPVMTA